MKDLSITEIEQMTKEEYIKTIIDLHADSVDSHIQDELMMDLVNRYVDLSKEYEKRIHEIELLSITDPLTKCYNRLKFNQVGEIELERFSRYGDPFAIILMDIDHFKNVNDSFGHDVGDKTLVRFANIVLQALRKNDIFARWGGEEFIALVVETDQTNAISLAERIRKSIDSALFEKIEHITVSIGVAMVNRGDTMSSIIKRADLALYEAKNSGRNQVVFQGKKV